MSIRLAAGALVWTLGLLWVAYFVVMSTRSRLTPSRGSYGPPCHYVILIPCRNEELVLRGTLESVHNLPRDRVRLVVIDDGSTDSTVDIASEFAGVTIVRRVGENTGQGKGSALNAGLIEIAATLEDDVVVGVLDADGRLESDVLDYLDSTFADPGVGAAQLSVRIRNREHVLGRFQDVEFVSFSHIMQAARQRTGTVGLGGNGQFVRMLSLRQLGPDPWSDCLTEDLDLGIRIAAAGWRIAFVHTAVVSQQGVTSIRALIRQRSRWLQGHLQCWCHISRIRRARLSTAATADMLSYVLAPAFLVLFGATWGVGLVSAFVQHVPMLSSGLSANAERLTVLRLVLTAIPCGWLAVVYRKRSGDSGWVRSMTYCGGLLLYNVIWCVAMGVACWSHARRHTRWVKTARVPEALSSRELIRLPASPSSAPTED